MSIKQTPRVYSYMRYSGEAQALGDSERRQVDGAREWAKRKGYELDEDLKDPACSGFSGAHRKKGALGRFLDAVKAGGVPSGSILVVENPDRLSREGFVNALRNIIGELWDRGISLQTLSPEETYPPGCENDPKVLALFLYLSRAHDESKRKSERVRAARDQGRKQARETRRIFTRRCPAWLDVVGVNGSASFKPIPAAADTIKSIFEMKLAGDGLRTIETRLNKGAAWSPPVNLKRKGSGWRTSYIRKILGNRAVVGEYQPHENGNGKRAPVGDPIADYFPRIVEPALYAAVQDKLKGNVNKGGQVAKAKNLLPHLVKCAYCGGSMAFLDRGALPKGGKYLVCDNGRRGVGCKRHTVRYEETEALVLANCNRLRPEEVLPNPDEQTRLCKSLRTRIEGMEAEMADIGRRINNLTDRIADTADRDMGDRYEAKVRDLIRRRAVLEADKAKDAKALADAEKGLESFANWKRDFDALQKALKGDCIDVRIRMRSHLRGLIDRIEVFAVGFGAPTAAPKPEPKERDGKGKVRWRDHSTDAERFADDLVNAIGEVDPDLAADPTFRKFLDHLDDRRKTRAGRFLRVRFATGATVDLVPEGSLAEGVRLERTNGKKAAWRFVSPDVNRLWESFKAKTGA